MIDLRQGDCLELIKNMESESIDCIFTDPPYKLTGGGIKNSLLRNNKNKNPFSTSGECFNIKTPNFNEWIPELYRVLKNDSYVFIMTNDKHLKEMWECLEKNKFKFCEILVMNKTNGVPSLYFFKSCEYILMFRKGNYKKFNRYGCKNVFNVKLPKGKNKTHPTEKPVNMIMEIIQCTTNTNNMVLDLFMGTGSTGVACVNTNRNFIGIELDKHYFNIAKQRIEETLNKRGEKK